MTIHIGENTQNVQMPAACSIDNAAEMAISNTTAPARYRDMSKINRLIEAHASAVEALEAANDAWDTARERYDGKIDNRQPFQITPDESPKIFLDMRLFTPVDVESQIERHYSQLERRIGWLPKQSQAETLSRIYEWKAETFSRVEDYRKFINADADECGLTSAEKRQSEAEEAEDQALMALLACQPLTASEGAQKSEHLRGTSWFNDVKNGTIYCRTVEAMMQGMGCGVAS